MGRFSEYPKKYLGQKGPGGRPLCVWCGTEVGRGRRSWCGQKCIDEYLIQKGGQTTRRAVYDRDRGVCAACGLNCPVAESFLWSLRWENAVWWRETIRQLKLGNRNDWWEADHIIAVELGGTNQLDNMQTLCVWCHRKKSAEDVRRIRQRKLLGKPDSGPGPGPDQAT